MGSDFIKTPPEIRAALSTNVLLSDALQLGARAHLSDAQRLLDALGLITSPSTGLYGFDNELDTQRMALMSHIEAYKLVLAPHRKLPDDILVEIFSNCAANTLHVPLILAETCWSLALVCSRWRQVALGISNLWNNIRVDCEVVWPIYLRRAALVRELFSRCGSSLITLKIKARSGTCLWDWTGDSNPISDLVIPHIRRVRRISIAVPAVWLNAFLDLPADAMGSVEELSLAITGKPSQKEIFSIFQNSPSLRKVTIDARLDKSIFHLPWAQLTDLHLPYVLLSPDAAVAIMKQCSSLARCTFLVQHDGPLADPPVYISISSIAVMSKLEELEINIDLCKNPIQFLQLLKLPVLRQLRVPKQFQPRRWDPGFIPIFTHSSSLQHLDLSMTIPADDIERLLKAAPQLIYLSLSGGHCLSDTTLDLMAGGDLVSELAYLACCVIDTISTFFDMLDCRWSVNPSPLRTVLLWTAEDLDENERYLRYLEDGRSITWK